MNEKMYYKIPGTANVFRMLRRAKCRHADQLIPAGSATDDCMECYIAKIPVLA